MNWGLLVGLIIVIPFILFPVAFAWHLVLGNTYAEIRESQFRGLAKQLAYGALFFQIGVFMPILIWVALFAAISKPLIENLSRLTLPWRQQVTPSNVCSINSDCPSGFVCLDGKCMPERIFIDINRLTEGKDNGEATE